MVTAIVLSSLLGAVLSLFIRYPVLIVASVAVLIVTYVNGIEDEHSLWFVVLSIVLSVDGASGGLRWWRANSIF